jgi:hypothetical protein
MCTGAVWFQSVLLVEVDVAVRDAGSETYRRLHRDDAVVQRHGNGAHRRTPARVLPRPRVVGRHRQRSRAVPRLYLGRIAQRVPDALDRCIDVDGDDDVMPHASGQAPGLRVVGGDGFVGGGFGLVAGGFVVGGTVAAVTGGAVAAVVGGGGGGDWCSEPPVRGASAPTT